MSILARPIAWSTPKMASPYPLLLEREADAEAIHALFAAPADKAVYTTAV